MIKAFIWTIILAKEGEKKCNNFFSKNNKQNAHKTKPIIKNLYKSVFLLATSKPSIV